ncbi:MAG: MFS transporter [Acidimicrobiales bacterium]
MIPVGLFTLAASVGMVFALLHELQEAHDLSGAVLGWMAGVAFFASVAAQMVLAPFADRGHARRVMVAAMIAGALASLAFAVASVPWQFIVARIAAGLAFGAFLPAAQAVVTAADPDRAGEHLGRLAGVQTAGFIIGPGIGSVMVAQFGLDAPFVVMAAITVGLVPWIATMSIDEVALDPERADQRPLEVTADMVRTMARIIRRRDALAATLISAALMLPAGMYEAIWAVFMSDLGASTTFIGVSLMLYGIPFIISAPIGGRLADKYGPLRVAPIAFLIIVPITIVYGRLTVPIVLMVFAMVEALGDGLGIPAAQALMASATGDGERATGQGLAAAAGQLVAGIAAITAAGLYENYGPHWTFTIVALAVAAVAMAGIAVGFSAGVERRRVPARIPRPLRIRGGGR